MKFQITILFILFSKSSASPPIAGSMLKMCGDTSPQYGDILVWNIPETAGVISLKSQNNLCWNLNKTVSGFSCDGYCVYLDTCGPSTPKFKVHDSMHIIVAQDPKHGTEGHCLDLEGGAHLQIYPCVSSKNQRFNASRSNGFVIDEWTGDHLVVGVAGPECKPSPENPFCPKYHPIRDSNIYDPSGPILTGDGVWHMWEDEGAWRHYTSRDLIHWNLTSKSSGFSGLTGSVVATPSGFFAFWPSGGQGGIETAFATDAPTLNTWTHRGVAIKAPSYTGKNFRDPLRALQFPETGGKDWYVGVGCNNHSKSADVCLFKATNDSLAEFKSVGSLFSTNKTFGQMDNDIVWKPTSRGATMMECPDIFPLGDKYMLIGSLFATNQWWIGTISGSSDNPRFTAENVGLMDYGNGYAAKAGSGTPSTGKSRRVVFSFTGWNEPTAIKSCGRSIILPRDLTLGKDGISPRINPVPETKILRINSSHIITKVSKQRIVLTSIPHINNHMLKGDLVVGSQVELSVTCKLPKMLPTKGKVALKVLETEDGSEYLEIGYNFGNQSMYADHTNCCDSDHPNSIIQNAPLSTSAFDSNILTIHIFVDGGLIEAFVNGQVTITPLVAPSDKTEATKRRNTFFITATGIDTNMCNVESWKLAY